MSAVAMPRELLLTPELQLRIKNFVIAGAPIPEACLACGVGWSTAKVWMRRGRAGEEPYVGFTQAMSEAKALHLTGCKLIVMSAAKGGDWKAAAWLIDRREMQQQREMQLRNTRPDDPNGPPRPPPPLAPMPDADDEERVVLLYPVPVPYGAHVSQLQLAPGHSIDTEGTDVTDDPEDDEET